jgi:acyl-coenzyme A thioesterase PaaI-like protein
MDADALNEFFQLYDHLVAPEKRMRIVEAEVGRVPVEQPLLDGMLRAGMVVSGPALMSVADCAAYAW